MGPFKCPEDTPVFSDTDGSCVKETADNCKPCEPSGGGGDDGECKYICEKNMEPIADPEDCSTYYICAKGDGDAWPAWTLTCSGDKPYFDIKEKKCQTDQTKCCDGCKSECGTDIQAIPDPYDCHSFYMCNGQEGPASLHDTCPSGQYFDTDKCTAGSSCDNLCSGDNPNPGGSTSPSGGSTTPYDGSSTSSDGSSTTPDPNISTTKDTNGCVGSKTCTETGLFAKCETCQKDFFYCSSVGGDAEIKTCSGQLVFNPDPAYPYCIQKENCPFHP